MMAKLLQMMTTMITFFHKKIAYKKITVEFSHFL